MNPSRLMIAFCFVMGTIFFNQAKAQIRFNSTKYTYTLTIKNHLKVDANDFREELKIEDGKSLIFTIHVANKNKEFQKIGKITLDTSVVSSSCDRRLHFHHPAWRDDLEYFLP